MAPIPFTLGEKIEILDYVKSNKKLSFESVAIFFTKRWSKTINGMEISRVKQDVKYIRSISKTLRHRYFGPDRVSKVKTEVKSKVKAQNPTGRNRKNTIGFPP